MQKIKIKITDLLLTFIYAFTFLYTFWHENSGKYLLIIVIIYNVYLILKHWNNQPMVVMLVFVLTYWIYMLLYYFLDIRYSGYANLQTLEYTNGTLRIISLFSIILFQAIKPKKGVTIRECLKNEENPIIYSIALVVMAFIVLFALIGTTILDGTYGENTTNSTLFEYYFIFALGAQCYTRKRIRKIFLLCVNIIYVFALLMLGLRLVALQVILMIFIFYYENKFKTRWVLVGSIIGFLFMSLISFVRIGQVGTLMEILGVRNGVLYTNQGDVFLTSTVHYGLTQIGFFNFETRISSLFAFIANIFLLPNSQMNIGVLNQFIEPYYRVGGGGFGAMYAYVWLSYFGVVGLATYLAHFINKIYRGKNGSIYGVFLVFTFFRWYSYSLPVVFKMGLYLFIFFLVSQLFNKRIRI